MMLDEDAIGPWPYGCNPEQCPYVAELFSNICNELNENSDIPNCKKAVWDAGTFGFAARRIRKNANVLLDATGEPKNVDAKVESLLDQYYEARAELGRMLDDPDDKMDVHLYSAELAKLNTDHMEKLERVLADG